MGLEGEELNQANARIAELNRQEQRAISDARNAYKNDKWNDFSRKVALVEKLRENKATELKSYNEKLSKVLENARTTERQYKIDSGVSGLLSPGIS